MTHLPGGPFTTISSRLAIALALALLPLLALAVLQAAIEFRRDGENRQLVLSLAVQASAASARAQIETAAGLLRTLTPTATGPNCAKHLAETLRLMPVYANLIRLDREGRVACAANAVPPDPSFTGRAWFKRLSDGAALVVSNNLEEGWTTSGGVLIATRAAAGGEFDGALAAVTRLDSLRLPAGILGPAGETRVWMLNAAGLDLQAASRRADLDLPQGWREVVRAKGSIRWDRPGNGGGRWLYSAEPLVNEEVYVVVATRSPSPLGWVMLRPLLGILFPLAGFLLALIAAIIATERVVVRWVAYMRPLSELYTSGPPGARAIKPDNMPSEFRELAVTLEDMSDTIADRDASLQDAAHKNEALLREVHHRVENNLQVISSMLSMEQRALTDPASQTAMSDTRRRIVALALIYRTLYLSPGTKRVVLLPFFEALIADLAAGDIGHGPSLRPRLSIEPIVVDPDILAPLALFAVEAIANAYGRTAAVDGELVVSLRARGDMAELEISDSGPAPDAALTESNVSRTLMNAFARQMLGHAELTRNACGGLDARLTFPVRAIRPAAAAN